MCCSPLLDDGVAEVSAIDAVHGLLALGQVAQLVGPVGSNLRGHKEMSDTKYHRHRYRGVARCIKAADTLHTVQQNAGKSGSAAAGPKVFRQLTPCSRTPVAPHFGGLARLVVYWKIRRPPADHGSPSANSACRLQKVIKVNCFTTTGPHQGLTWRLDLLGLVGPAGNG